MATKKIKTIEEVRDDFRRKGLTIRAWAAKHGVSERTTYAVISGENKGNYGKAHEIAVLLGLKDGEINAAC